MGSSAPALLSLDASSAHLFLAPVHNRLFCPCLASLALPCLGTAAPETLRSSSPHSSPRKRNVGPRGSSVHCWFKERIGRRVQWCGRSSATRPVMGQREREVDSGEGQDPSKVSSSWQLLPPSPAFSWPLGFITTSSGPLSIP